MIRNLAAWFKPEWYARVYELALDGVKPSRIGPALGIPDHTWRRCWNCLPAVRDAARRGQERNKSRKEMGGMPGYVHRHLPPELRETWDKLEGIFDAEKNPEAFVEGVMAGHGLSARKALYLHALVCGNFDGHGACRKVGVSAQDVHRWCQQDPAYARLVREEVWEIKCDLVESAVFRAVQRGSTPEILWAAKCLLKRRGYSTQRDDDRGRVAEALSARVELDKLGVEELRQLLEITRTQGGGRALPPKVVEGEVVDAQRQ